MQIIYAITDKKTDYMSEKPICVNNCGIYRNLERNININRPHGRKDYHILAVSSGRIYVNGTVLESENAYLFFPSSPQRYIYESGEGSEYYWIHFSGSQISELLEKYALSEGKIHIGSSHGELERIIKMMFRAITEKYRFADEFCEGMLISLLALLGAPPVVSSPYCKAIKMLEDATVSVTVDALAAMYNMSPNHFIRSFKQYVGMSPNAYRIKKRMEIAEEMLVSSDMGIAEIAAAVGYDDPLYFSRAFKKHTGHSPTSYRKSEN